MPESTDVKYEVKRWAYHQPVYSHFAATEPRWKEVTEQQLRDTVMRESGAIAMELEELVDERETPAFKNGHRSSMWPDLFVLSATYKVTVPVKP